jgi:Cu/Ag efflux pump CusA
VIVGALNTPPVPRSRKENESRPARPAPLYAAEAKERIARELTLPSGSWLSWDGQFENLMAAWQRLAFVVPGCFLLIFLLL